jgi:hypothetical protein
MRANVNLLRSSDELKHSTGHGGYDKIFNSQYEGLVEFNSQIAELRSMDGDPNKADDTNEDLKLSAKALEKLSTEMTFTGIKAFKNHYETNGPLNQGVVRVAFDDLNGKGAELESLRLLEYTNKKDKDRQNQLMQEVSAWRKNLVEIKPLITSTVKGIVEGHYNEELSFADDIELGPVLKQWLDPNSDYDQLGIGTFFDKSGEMYITYTPGQVFKSEYENNKRKINFDPREEASLNLVKRELEQAAGMTQSIDDEIREEMSSKPPTNVIKVKDALSKFVKKDVKTGNKINDTYKEILKTSENKIPTSDNQSKIYEFENFDLLEAMTYDSYKELFLTPDSETGDYANIQDLSTRDQLIAGQMRNYKKDLMDEKSFVHQLKYEDLGLNKSQDTNKDGFISQGELNDASKNALVEVLTNPKTSFERNIAAEQWAWYLTSITKQAVNSKRKRQERASKIPVETATAGLTRSAQEATEEGATEISKTKINW